MQPLALGVRDVLCGGTGYAHTAVKARQGSGFRQPLNIAAHGLKGDREFVSQLLHRDGASGTDGVNQFELAGVEVHGARRRMAKVGDFKSNQKEIIKGKP
jgi:hypothetical protein